MNTEDYFFDYRREEITFSRLGTQTLNTSIVLYGFVLCTQTVHSRNYMHRNIINKVQTPLPSIVFFGENPCFLRNPR